jgi:hypothetical protein
VVALEQPVEPAGDEQLQLAEHGLGGAVVEAGRRAAVSPVMVCRPLS